MFPPDLSQLTEDHLQALIDQQVPEGQAVEYKQELPAKKGERDPWMDGGKLGDRARNEILDEVCAFANAEGGHLVLGMAQTDAKPPRAAAIMPLPRVVALADSLRMQIRDCIEPQLLHVHVAEVPVGADGGGAIVIRVPESGNAPHRVGPTRHATRRHADRSERMTMRDIQALTLQRAATIESRLAELARSGADFATRFDWLRASMKGPTQGVHVAAIPRTGDLSVPSLARSDARFPYWGGNFRGIIDGKREVDLALPMVGLSNRPILRGCMRYQEEPDQIIRLRALQDGSVDYMLITANPQVPYLPIDWPLGLLLSAIATVHELRLQALAPEVEYVMAIELRAAGMPLRLANFFTSSPYENVWDFEEPRCELPRLILGPITDIHSVASMVASDLVQAAGRGWSYGLEIKPPLDLLEHWEEAGTPLTAAPSAKID